MTRSWARFSGSARRNATSVIDCAASRMSWARRTITAKAQNRMTGTSAPTREQDPFGARRTAGRGERVCQMIGPKRRSASKPHAPSQTQRQERRRPSRRCWTHGGSGHAAASGSPSGDRRSPARSRGLIGWLAARAADPGAVYRGASAGVRRAGLARLAAACWPCGPRAPARRRPGKSGLPGLPWTRTCRDRRESRQIEIESVFKFLGRRRCRDLGRGRFFRHAAVTLYSRCANATNWHICCARGLLWTRRIVVAQTGKGNMQSGRCVKL